MLFTYPTTEINCQITNLANASSLIYNSLLAFPSHFGPDDNKAVNWCGQSHVLVINRREFSCDVRCLGFYLDSHLFPVPRGGKAPDSVADGTKTLLLGPFCGKPACQFINISPKPRGVCADAFIQGNTIVVPEVDLYPGHIACDGETKSELVCPLILHGETGAKEYLGVLDLDCLAINGFDTDDKVGLEKIARLIVNACDW